MGDSEEDRKERVEKYRQLYSRAEAAFKDEENRYIRVEDVALKYVPILLFLFGVAGYFAKWILDEMIVCIDSLEVAAITCISISASSIRCPYASSVLLFHKDRVVQTGQGSRRRLGGMRFGYLLRCLCQRVH